MFIFEKHSINDYYYLLYCFLPFHSWECVVNWGGYVTHQKRENSCDYLCMLQPANVNLISGTFSVNSAKQKRQNNPNHHFCDA